MVLSPLKAARLQTFDSTEMVALDGLLAEKGAMLCMRDRLREAKRMGRCFYSIVSHVASSGFGLGGESPPMFCKGSIESIGPIGHATKAQLAVKLWHVYLEASETLFQPWMMAPWCRYMQVPCTCIPRRKDLEQAMFNNS